MIVAKQMRIIDYSIERSVCEWLKGPVSFYASGGGPISRYCQTNALQHDRTAPFSKKETGNNSKQMCRWL